MFAPPRRCLEVTVGSTPTLKENRSSNGSKNGAGSEPFAVVRLGQQQQRSDAGLPAGSRSAWNHRFNFLLDDGEKDPEELGVEVWDRVDGEEKCAGSCSVDLAQVFEKGFLEAVRPVHRRNGKLLGHIRFYLCLLVEDPAADLDTDSPPPYTREALEPLQLNSSMVQNSLERWPRPGVKEEMASLVNSRVKDEVRSQPWTKPSAPIVPEPSAVASAGALLQAFVAGCMGGEEGQHGGAGGDVGEFLKKLHGMLQPAKAPVELAPRVPSERAKLIRENDRTKNSLLQQNRQQERKVAAGLDTWEKVTKAFSQQVKAEVEAAKAKEQEQQQQPLELAQEGQQQQYAEQWNYEKQQYLLRQQQLKQENLQQEQQQQKQQQQAGKTLLPSTVQWPACGGPEALLLRLQSMERRLMDSPRELVSPRQTVTAPSPLSPLSSQRRQSLASLLPSGGLDAGSVCEQAVPQQQQQQQQQHHVVTKPRPVHHQMLPPKSPGPKASVPFHEPSAPPASLPLFPSPGVQSEAKVVGTEEVKAHSGDGPARTTRSPLNPTSLIVPGTQMASGGMKKPPPLDVSFSSSHGHCSDMLSPSGYLQSPSLSCLITSPAPWSPLNTPSSAAAAAASCFGLMSPSSPFFHSAFGQRHRSSPHSGLTHIDHHGSPFSPPAALSAVPAHMLNTSAGREPSTVNPQAMMATSGTTAAAGHPYLDLSMMSPARGSFPSSSEHSGVTTSTRSSGRLGSSQDEIAAALHKAFSPVVTAGVGETKDGFAVPRSPSVLRPSPSSPPKSLGGERLKESDVQRLLASVGVRPPAPLSKPTTPTMGGKNSAFSSPRLCSPSSRTAPGTPRSASSGVGLSLVITPTACLKRLHTVEEDGYLQLGTPQGRDGNIESVNCPWREPKRMRVAA
eukprot:TRINITY_DN435_c0_g2_i1.p1 TRINITY_DN435_c0_g2~~TRINITY_DN435_c0_g2_i1.p1  ORF type:complete len:899 (-),score=194.26 TRINITY_DN435_c0_g2_i1:2219-4915(-)